MELFSLRTRLLLVVVMVTLAVPTAAIASSGAGFYAMSCAHSRCTTVYHSAQAPDVVALPGLAPLFTPAIVPPALTSFTWTGATPTSTTGASNWSTGTNWASGVAPAGSVGTLTFPALTSSACTSSPPTDTCYQSNDDITGLGAHRLSIDDAVGYLLGGDTLKLGAGGLTARTTSSTSTGEPSVFTPVTITAAQTWTIDGHNQDDQLELEKATGPAHALTIDLDNETFLNTANIEVGPLTISTADTEGLSGSVALGTGGRLNATDDEPVSLAGNGTGIFAAGNASTGALTAENGTIQIGNGISQAARLSVDGGFTQESSNALNLNVVQSGTTAGTDYSQLSATGDISLAGNLNLSGSTSGSTPTCPTLTVGDVDTLLRTTGTLTGTFAGVPNGSIEFVNCSGGTEPTGTIKYGPHAVTFTVTGAGG